MSSKLKRNNPKKQTAALQGILIVLFNTTYQAHRLQPAVADFDAPRDGCHSLPLCVTLCLQLFLASAVTLA
jgi:hypothetical protein